MSSPTPFAFLDPPLRTKDDSPAFSSTASSFNTLPGGGGVPTGCGMCQS